MKHIFPYIPSHIKKLCSPFFGGGCIELSLNYYGIEIRGYDISEPLVNFWDHVFDNTQKWSYFLQHYLFELTPTLRFRLHRLVKNYHNFDKYKRALIYLISNYHSFGGKTFAGFGKAPIRGRVRQYTNVKILKLKKGVPFSIQCKGHQKAILENPDCFLYLDPPYFDDNNKYGLKGVYNTKVHSVPEINHYNLFDILDTRDSWILSYNDCPEIRVLYKDYRIVNIINHVTASSLYRGEKIELLILSKDIDDLLCKGSLFDY